MQCTIEPNEAEAEFLENVFSGIEPMPSVQSLLVHTINDACHTVFYLALLREACAMSGAMRWPWSQEARITMHHVIRVE